jgi:hypothetical protein
MLNITGFSARLWGIAELLLEVHAQPQELLYLFPEILQELFNSSNRLDLQRDGKGACRPWEGRVAFHD